MSKADEMFFSVGFFPVENDSPVVLREYRRDCPDGGHYVIRIGLFGWIGSIKVEADGTERSANMHPIAARACVKFLEEVGM